MILTAIVRNSRLTHIEERLSKLQSICQTAGLLPSEEQADTADDIFSPQGHQKSNGIDGNGKTQLHSVQAPPGPQFHDTEQGRTVPTPSTAEPDRPESGATETRDTAMSHDGKSGHLRGPESECFQDQTCPVVDATSHRASSSGQLAFLDDGVTSPHYPDQRPSTASCAIAVSSEMQTRASQSNVHAAPESDSMHATTLHDTTFHFETLAMVFADRSETKLLDELYSMVPSLTPVPLPTQDAMYAAMTNFFRSFDKLIPLFDEASTFHLVELFYSPMPFVNPDLAAYIYSVVALSYACSSPAGTSSCTVEDVEQTAWKYFGHAATHIPQLMASQPGLLSIQALLGMVRSVSSNLAMLMGRFLGMLSHDQRSHQDGSSTRFGSYRGVPPGPWSKSTELQRTSNLAIARYRLSPLS